MNSVLSQQDELVIKIKEMLRDEDNLKSDTDIFGELIKEKLSE